VGGSGAEGGGRDRPTDCLILVRPGEKERWRRREVLMSINAIFRDPLSHLLFSLGWAVVDAAYTCTLPVGCGIPRMGRGRD
jgi:hypothetical protein